MTTYTIALLNDMLMATVVDGSDIEKAVNDEISKIGSVEDDSYRGAFSKCEIITGVTLANSEPETGEVVYSGTDAGWLEDENGVNYTVAYKA